MTRSARRARFDSVRNRVERECRRRHEAADEPASRLVVAAQQQEDGKEQEQRHQETSGRAKDRRRHRLVRCRFHDRSLDGCQPEQRAHADRGCREDRDLAHRVERAEVHQDDVDDIAPVAQCQPELGEILAQPRCGLGRRHPQHQSANQRSHPGSNEGITEPDQPR